MNGTKLQVHRVSGCIPFSCLVLILHSFSIDANRRIYQLMNSTRFWRMAFLRCLMWAPGRCLKGDDPSHMHDACVVLEHYVVLPFCICIYVARICRSMGLGFFILTYITIQLKVRDYILHEHLNVHLLFM